MFFAGLGGHQNFLKSDASQKAAGYPESQISPGRKKP